jgi:hypothetical protein
VHLQVVSQPLAARTDVTASTVADYVITSWGEVLVDTV